MITLPAKAKEALDQALAKGGMRSTRQREQIYAVLLKKRDHPSADEVYSRAKEVMPTISLATVYNCLETLVDCGLIKKLNYEREPSRFCPNDGEHAHFLDEANGRVYDILLPPEFHDTIRNILPEGFEAKKVKLSFTGYAPKNIDSNVI
ncbi:MAG: transcriptional repressor [Verrucomicrobiota bacterium]